MRGLLLFGKGRGLFDALLEEELAPSPTPPDNNSTPHPKNKLTSAKPSLLPPLPVGGNTPLFIAALAPWILRAEASDNAVAGEIFRA